MTSQYYLENKKEKTEKKTETLDYIPTIHLIIIVSNRDAADKNSLNCSTDTEQGVDA